MPITEAMMRAEETLGYQFKDRSLLEAALTHASYAGHRLSSNERLEFYGDSVLGMIVCEALYNQFPDLLEGELTKIKSAVVSRRTCAKVAISRGLDQCVLLGKGMDGHKNLPTSISAAVYEAMIAALYFDGGFEVARQFVLQDMHQHINAAAESENQQNYKSHLQQYAQKHLDATPIYEMLDEKGPDHSKCFEVCVIIAGRRFPSAWGPSKKDSEQKAALNALKSLKVVQDDACQDQPQTTADH